MADEPNRNLPARSPYVSDHFHLHFLSQDDNTLPNHFLFSSFNFCLLATKRKFGSAHRVFCVSILLFDVTPGSAQRELLRGCDSSIVQLNSSATGLADVQTI